MSPARRFLALLFAVAQTSLGAGYAVVDGRLEAQAIAEAAASHVEAEGSPSCPPQHLAECAVCRALEVLAGPSRGTSLSGGAPTVPAAVAATERDPLLQVAGRLPDARAPPLPRPGASRPRSS